MNNHPFTSTYIAMARAAEEIQAMRLGGGLGYEYGDAFLSGSQVEWIGKWKLGLENGPYASSVAADYDYERRQDWECGNPSAWLPRLDQLLGMIDRPMGLIRARWSDLFADDPADMHEATLSAVMLARFGKRWDSAEGKWVKT